MQRLWSRGERFDIAAGASSGSISGAVWVSGLAEEAPAFWRALAKTPIVSRRYLKTERSPFGMSIILRDALEKFVPERQIVESEVELLVSTTRARRLIMGALAGFRGAHDTTLSTASRIRSMAIARDALVVHSSKGRNDMHDVIVASCTIPGVYARLPVLDGEVHIDGGAADNTLIHALLDRGATEITVVTPYDQGAVSPTMFERERPPTVPPHVRLRLIWPERPIRLGRFDFDHGRLEEALTMPHVERVFEPISAAPSHSEVGT
jgi:NTE family protein